MRYRRDVVLGQIAAVLNRRVVRSECQLPEMAHGG